MQCELCSDAGQGGETRCRRCGFDTTLPPDIKTFVTSLIGFRPGELLEGRYRIDRILGYGGMSVVYKAHDDVLGEDVAIKVINRVRASDDGKLFTDIRRDIVSTRKLAHPDIVKVHDLHQAETCGFLTMEFVQGKDLASLIAERGKLAEGDVCRVAVQIAEALNYAHANGVVHCDIKPGNLLLTETGRVKIADFGISRVMQEENTGLTGLVVGTPAYMSPEQIRGERPTPLTDMYALGIVMWHCLMGRPPFTRGDIAYQQVHVPLPPMDGVSPELEGIVRKAASKSMADRYPSLEDMAREIHQLLGRQADATLMQTPPPRQMTTIMQTAPPRPAATLMQTPPPQQAATTMQTPPPRAAGSVMHDPPPQRASSVDETTPPRPAGSIMHTPPPQPVPIHFGATGGEARTGDEPATGGPAAGGPAGETAPPSPATPDASPNTKIAAAAVAILLVGAALWGLSPRSRQAAPGVGSESPLVGSGIPAGVGTATGAGSSPGPSAPAGGTPPAPTKITPAKVTPAKTAPAETAPLAAAASPTRQAIFDSPQSDVPAASTAVPASKCSESACFEIFDAKLTPAVARPGQTVICTARYTFRHNEGGKGPLAVEESVKPDIRSSRGGSRRIKAEQGSHFFRVSFAIPSRTREGTYPVALSVRRRRISESVELQLVVTK